MAIFNSYVKLPGGIKNGVFAKEYQDVVESFRGSEMLVSFPSWKGTEDV